MIFLPLMGLGRGFILDEEKPIIQLNGKKKKRRPPRGGVRYCGGRKETVSNLSWKGG